MSEKDVNLNNQLGDHSESMKENLPTEIHNNGEIEQSTIEPTKKATKAKWPKVLFAVLITLAAATTFLATDIMSLKNSEGSWLAALKDGDYGEAVGKFSTLTSNTIGNVLDADLSVGALVKDFNAARPLLKKAGYSLTELEVSLSIPPKLIPHFYHDPKVHLDLKKVLASLEGNHIGTVVMVALAEASELQKELEVSGLKFSHIEIELGPIPTLKLKYKK
ncbi:MAG: hypothetical protein Q9M20_04395 [Mariprofundaceae bacterium]|nr:hypothetical protein [Mariprofundaceae bacterium]